MAKRVYFAFHYQDVIDFRANVVRKHNFLGVESAGYYDHSIWEEAKQFSPLALKRLINSELQNTSVTTVFIGSSKWARRWVRYEIMRSIERGNRVLGIHINSIKRKNQMTKVSGPNPFDNLGLEISAGRHQRPSRRNGAVTNGYTISDLPTHLTLISSHGISGGSISPAFQIGYRLSEWVGNRGYDNFSTWIS